MKRFKADFHKIYGAGRTWSKSCKFDLNGIIVINMLKLKIFVILFAIMLQINGDTCGGANCPTGKCPTCYCGRQQHLVDIA